VVPLLVVLPWRLLMELPLSQMALIIALEIAVVDMAHTALSTNVLSSLRGILVLCMAQLLFGMAMQLTCATLIQVAFTTLHLRSQEIWLYLILVHMAMSL